MLLCFIFKIVRIVRALFLEIICICTWWTTRVFLKIIDKIFGKVFCTCWYAEEFLKINGMEILQNKLYWNATKMWNNQEWYSSNILYFRRSEKAKNDICQKLYFLECNGDQKKAKNDICPKNCTSADQKKQRMIFVNKKVVLAGMQKYGRLSSHSGVRGCFSTHSLSQTDGHQERLNFRLF